MALMVVMALSFPVFLDFESGSLAYFDDRIAYSFREVFKVFSKKYQKICGSCVVQLSLKTLAFSTGSGIWRLTECFRASDQPLSTRDARLVLQRPAPAIGRHAPFLRERHISLLCCRATHNSLADASRGRREGSSLPDSGRHGHKHIPDTPGLRVPDPRTRPLPLETRLWLLHTFPSVHRGARCRVAPADNPAPCPELSDMFR